uniref:Candidate secreted effector n=1 Tax=Meloidogyne incognita TaxID=6306 RepID=A0A914M9P1_MELIC
MPILCSSSTRIISSIEPPSLSLRPSTIPPRCQFPLAVKAIKSFIPRSLAEAFILLDFSGVLWFLSIFTIISCPH